MTKAVGIRGGACDGAPLKSPPPRAIMELMGDKALKAYESPARHAAVSDIIRQASTNQTDVREAVLRGLDLSGFARVLDLGCGFGFMTQTIARRVAADAHIVGVDACPRNEGPFLEKIAEAKRKGRFIHHVIDSRLDWADGSFDLVVASYALYFFPDILSEIARVLTPGGLLIAVTHTEQSCRDLLRVAGVRGRNSRLLTLVHAFSAENADSLLAPWFEQWTRIDYHNSLTFDPPQRDDLIRYLRFKLSLLSPDSQPGGDLPAPLARTVRTSLAKYGRVVLDKHDMAFHCRRPRCP